MSRERKDGNPFIDPKYDSGIFPGYEAATEVETQDRERRTIAQEQGVVLSKEEFSKFLNSQGKVPTPVDNDLPNSVHDVLNGAVGRDRVQSRTWLRVSRPKTNGSRS